MLMWWFSCPLQCLVAFQCYLCLGFCCVWPSRQQVLRGFCCTISHSLQCNSTLMSWQNVSHAYSKQPSWAASSIMRLIKVFTMLSQLVKNGPTRPLVHKWCLTEKVNRIQSRSWHTTGHFGDKSFSQSLCIGNDNQIHINQENIL